MTSHPDDFQAVRSNFPHHRTDFGGSDIQTYNNVHAHKKITSSRLFKPDSL
jgi:hypothetical protein